SPPVAISRQPFLPAPSVFTLDSGFSSMASAPSSSAKLKASAPPTAEVIDGRQAAADVTARVAVETDRLEAERGITPGLAVVLVGDDPASKLYVAGKSRTAEEIG